MLGEESLPDWSHPMSEKPRRLTVTEVQDALNELSGWTVSDGKLRREYLFADFAEAFGFMASAAVVAESMNHHPDWSNSWNKVVVELVTHSAGGITTYDLALARKMQALAAGRTAT